MPTPDEWSDELAAVLIDVARGDFGARMTRSGNRDQLDAIAFLVNNTAEEVRCLFHEVARQRDFVQAILESVPDCILVLDANDCIETVNPAACGLLGRPAKSLLGLPLGALLAREADQPPLVAMMAALKLRELPGRLDVEFSDGDGAALPVALHGRALAASGVDDRVSVLVARDMRGVYRLMAAEAEAAEAQRRRAEDLAIAKQAAEAGSKAKSAFLASMSHEIRTPLTAIVGIADILAQSRLQPAVRADWLRDLKESSTHLLSLVNNVLDLSKIEAGEITTDICPSSVTEVMDSVASTLKAGARKRRLNFSVSVDGNVPAAIMTDPLRLRQILINLVGNAIKYTLEGGVSIHIGVEPCAPSEHGELAITVKDTGIGIAPDRLADIFDPFSQIESKTSASRGTGLGLCISQRLAALIGGEISVRSEVGSGSTFTYRQQVVLPASEGLAASPTSHAAEGAASPLDDVHVLVVEDTPATQRIIRHFLERAGARVGVASNGLQGVEDALKNEEAGTPYEMILMDIQMPVMDGYAATARLRRSGINVPIIALTAYAMKEDEERCLRAGCSGYVSKPVSEDVLLDRLSRELFAARARGA